MHKRLLGATGKEVSLLGFGCMRLPLLDPKDPGSIDYDLATAMLRKGIENGVNYVDTAYPYHRKAACASDLTAGGESEVFVGAALANGLRDKVMLATKLPSWAVKDRAHMDTLLNEQLARLQTDHIDFYLAHNLNQNVWPKVKDMGLFDFLDTARKDGRIRHVGFSFHDRYGLFEEIVNAYPWEFVQIQYNYLDVNYQAGRRGLDLAASKGMGIVVMEPLRGGFLVNSIPDTAKDIFAKANPDRTLAGWGLEWLWDHKDIAVVLSGMSTMEQVEENVALAANFTSLTEAERAAVAGVREFFQSRIKAGCTVCAYCMPCPAGVNIPKLLPLYNDYHLFDSDAGRATAKSRYNITLAKTETASNCIHCGACEEKCPQHIAISETMTAIESIFGH